MNKNIDHIIIIIIAVSIIMSFDQGSLCWCVILV